MDITTVMRSFEITAVKHAALRNCTLVGTEASLEQVDTVLHHLTQDGFLIPRTKEDEDAIWKLAQVYGGYVGEVVIRELGGHWELHPLPSGGSQVVLHTHGIQAFPCERVYKRLTEDEFSNVGGYCRALRKILELQERHDGPAPVAPSNP